MTRWAVVQGMVRASAEAEVRARQGESKGGNVAGTQKKRVRIRVLF